MRTKDGAALLLSLIGLVALAVPAHADDATDAATVVQGGPYRLHAQTFTGEKTGSEPLLVVVIHGDSPFSAPSYQYLFAANVAARHPDVVAVGLLRPGYADPDGNQSEGERGLTNGDNWHAGNTDAIAAAIKELADRHDARKTIVVGHSGGAAITANMLGRHAELIDAALLVGCPCGDLKAWRESMFKLTAAPVFEGDIETLSPITLVDGLSPAADIVMMVGSEDGITPPVFSESYVAAAAEAGKEIELVRAAGKPHDMLLDDIVYAKLSEMLDRARSE